jgi:hypothetical protein
MAIALLALLVMVAAPAGAFPLSGCTLNLTSQDASGATIATAVNGGADSTQQNPFLVEWDGTVAWTGTMGSQVIRNHSWHIDVFYIPTPLRGGDPNEGGDTDGDGTVGVSENAPFQLVGTFYVSGELTGEGGSCSGSGWMKLAGDPFGTVPFWIALALILVGIVLIALGLRGSLAAGIFGGIFLGVGLALMLVITSILPLGAATPLAVMGLGLLIGIAAGWVGRANRRVATS